MSDGMRRIIVFDVNETLLNVRHLEPLFEEALGDKAATIGQPRRQR